MGVERATVGGVLLLMISSSALRCAAACLRGAEGKVLVHSLPLGIAAIAPDVLRSLPVVHHILPDALGIHLLQLLPVTHHVGTLGKWGWLCTGCTRLGKVDVLVNVLLLLLDCCTLGCMHQAVLD